MDRARERRRRAARRAPARAARRVSLEVERAQHELVEPAGAAQVVAQAPHAVVAREPVGAVGGDHEHRQLAERLGERGQQLERRLVGPLQVVEDDERVPLGGDVGERAAHRLEQRRAVGRRGRLAELGQQQRELRRAAGPQPSRPPGCARRWLRSAATSGPYGRACRPGSARRAGRSASAPAASSAASRVLPTPASPLSSTIDALRRGAPARSARLEPLALRLPTDEPLGRSWRRSLSTACRAREVRQSRGWRGAAAPVASSHANRHGPRPARKETHMELYVIRRRNGFADAEDLAGRRRALDRRGRQARLRRPLDPQLRRPARRAASSARSASTRPRAPRRIRAHADASEHARRRDRAGRRHRRRAPGPGQDGGLRIASAPAVAGALSRSNSA